MSSILDSISQPTLMLDCDTAKTNLNRMYQKINAAGIRFRPHFKTHQSAEIGQWFREKGVEAITVSSVEMAEYFAAAGWQNILIAFSLNIRQMDRIRQLAQAIHLEVLVEDANSVDVLAASAPAAFDVWIKIDAGAHRTGVDWQQVQQVQDLARSIEQRRNLDFRGLLTHSGNTYHVNSPAAVAAAFREGVDHLNWLRRQLSGSFGGIEVSVGDTPGCSLCADLSGIDELRPGNFLFYDAQQLLIGSCRPEEIAVAVACPVVAVHPDRNEVVLYGGAIHLSKDWVDLKDGLSFGLATLPQGNRWGLPIEGAVVRSLSQEHGIIRFRETLPAEVRPGGLLFILPAHSCLTVQELKKYLTLQGEVIHTMNG
jgi:D-serine deaminase-like pyridoxal phosphate-dependent protein